MVKKLLVGLVLAVFVSASFAGYSGGGGRSGFSGGARSFSSARSSSFSSGRSGYARSTNATRYRTYTAPSYRSHSTSTVINNHHYSHGGYGIGGNGFFSGMLGGYIGGSLANYHQPVVVAGGVGGGQGMLVEGGQPYVSTESHQYWFIFVVLFFVIAFIFIIKAMWWLMDGISCSHHRNRW